MSFYQKLYGLEKGGKFKVWSVSVELCEGTTGRMEISHGQEGGKQTVKPEFFEEGNQGRNGYEQAVFEARARIKKQMDKNYRATKEELTDLPVLAMLSKDHTKDGKDENIEEGVYTSRKLDGVRCLAKCIQKLSGVDITLESRTGQLYDVPHIVEELRKIMKPGDILDGELYVHGPSLQEITSAVKRTDAAEKRDKLYLKAAKALGKGDNDGYEKALNDYEDARTIANIREQLEFHVFDVVVMDVPFSERYEMLLEYAKKFLDGGRIVLVQYDFASSVIDVNSLLKQYIDEGYEGLMYRTRDGLYESGKRSAGLWKYKLFFDDEFEIIGSHVDKQGYIVFELRNNLNDEEFDCVLGDYNWRLQAVEEKELYIGKWMTVQYQSRFKGTLKPQFPTGKLIREGQVINGKFVPSE